MQEVEHIWIRYAFNDVINGGWVVEVTSGGRVNEQEVVADQVDQSGGVVHIETHSWGTLRGDGRAHHAVVTPAPLANIVKEGTDQEQIWPIHFTRQRAGLDRCLH